MWFCTSGLQQCGFVPLDYSSVVLYLWITAVWFCTSGLQHAVWFCTSGLQQCGFVPLDYTAAVIIATHDNTEQILELS